MRHVGFLVTALVLWIGACGGSITTVDGNKPVGTLTPTDKGTLCQDVYTYSRIVLSSTDYARIACGLRGGTIDSPTCMQDFQTCVQDLAPKLMFPQNPNCDGFNQALAVCGNITVSQWEVCFKQSIDLMKSISGSLPFCTRADQQQLAFALSGKLSAQCIQIWSRCYASFSGSTMPPPPK